MACVDTCSAQLVFKILGVSPLLIYSTQKQQKIQTNKQTKMVNKNVPFIMSICRCQFTSLLPYESSLALHQLLEEFTGLQLLECNDIPHDIWEQTVVTEEGKMEYH